MEGMRASYSMPISSGRITNSLSVALLFSPWIANTFVPDVSASR